MKIALLGGSFDPPHVGHQLLATQIREHLQLDQVWFVPCFIHPFNKNLSPATDRLSMVKLLENDVLRAHDIEIQQQKISYTIDTLSLIITTYPQHTFFWIIGSDQLENFYKWKEWKTLVNDFNLIIFPRDTALNELEGKVKRHLHLEFIPKNITLICDPDIIVTSVSSTEIRNKVKDEKSIKYLVDKKVREYIKKNKLYI